VRSQRLWPDLAEGLHSALLAKPTLRCISLLRTNTIKGALARAYVGFHAGHSEKMRSLAVSGVMDAAIPRTCLNKKVISTLSTSWWMKQGMIVSYEELQTDVVGAMTRVARFLGLAVSLPEMQRVYGKDVGVFKKSKEGLAMPTLPQLHAHDA